MPSLHKINNLLLVLIIVTNGYLILAPFYPKVHLWWQLHINHQQQKLEKVIKQPVSKSSRTTREGQWLIIPKLALDTQIFEGPDIATASKGVWHRPKSSNPEKGSNTVLVGHRFTYTDPKGVFYSLDKLVPGDDLALFWNDKKYIYKVREVKVVQPGDKGVEAATSADQLTLYTCTPLWSAKNRLVITANRSGL